MCKILVTACAVPGYDVNNKRAMINWREQDWKKLMQCLAELVGTPDPYEDQLLKELYIACFENLLLAGHRRTLEDDIKHKDERETVSLSDKEQNRFQYVAMLFLLLKGHLIHTYLFWYRKHITGLVILPGVQSIPDGPSNTIRQCMKKLHRRTGDGSVLRLLSPTDLAQYFCKEPFLFDWVIKKIESVVEECNSRRFKGQEAVLSRIGYDLPPWFGNINNIDQQLRQGTPAHRSPERTQSPVARSQYLTPRSTRAAASSSQDDFLQEHNRVPLGSIHHATPKVTPNSERKRKDPEIFDEQGCVKIRRKWTDGQTNAILAGLKFFGKKANRWSLILNEYPAMFEGRTSVMIKDRFRTLKNTGKIPPNLLAELGEPVNTEV
jgi:hypothetical protein